MSAYETRSAHRAGAIRIRTGIAMLALGVTALALAAGRGHSAEEKEEIPFPEWQAELRTEAIARGISPETFDAAFADVAPIERVIELDRSQPEFTLTLDQYLTKVVPRSRIEAGRRMYAANRSLLVEIGEHYGVQPRFIVALWGIETNFGEHTGGFSVIAALATLAHDGRRSQFFRRELLDALQILEDGHITHDRMVGSWAGAMGQNQFMPTSFSQFAVDWDKDGRRDIWTNRGDVFASTANYLSSYGWNDEFIWGRPVNLPADFDSTLADMDVKKTLAVWQRIGIRRVDGTDLPRAELEASVVRGAGSNGRGYLAYPNFEVIMRWNRSTYFATAVGTLADGIVGR